MIITNEVNMPQLGKAEKFWKAGKFKEASEKYHEAALIAEHKLKDIRLSKKLYVEYQLALISANDSLSNELIGNLLKSIEDLIEYAEDDRLELKFRPYRDFFSIIIHNNNGNYAKLETIKMILSDNLSDNNITDYELLNLIVIEIALAKKAFLQGKGNQKTLRKLSLDLDQISEKSAFPKELKRKLQEFSLKITNEFENDNTDEKKNLK